ELPRLVRPIHDLLVEDYQLARLAAVERQERISQYLKQPGPQMRSRLEPVGEAEGAEVGLLDQVLGIRRPPGEVQGKAVKSVQVRERLRTKVGWGIGQRGGLRPATLAETGAERQATGGRRPGLPPEGEDPSGVGHLLQDLADGLVERGVLEFGSDVGQGR